MEFFRIKKDIPFMRHALVFNVISLLTFLLAVFFLATRGLHLAEPSIEHVDIPSLGGVMNDAARGALNRWLVDYARAEPIYRFDDHAGEITGVAAGFDDLLQAYLAGAAGVVEVGAEGPERAGLGFDRDAGPHGRAHRGHLHRAVPRIHAHQPQFRRHPGSRSRSGRERGAALGVVDEDELLAGVAPVAGGEAVEVVVGDREGRVDHAERLEHALAQAVPDAFLRGAHDCFVLDSTKSSRWMISSPAV